jgi:hypothetical protein
MRRGRNPAEFRGRRSRQRKTGIHINVDATAVARAGNGASSLRNAIAAEIQRFISGREGSTGAPIEQELALIHHRIDAGSRRLEGRQPEAPR